MERVYKTMKVTGAGCIAAGVVIGFYPEKQG